ncbi:MAG: fasciclin domain-containing protein [Myxococcales bacterium]|nr:fasciclin domain-containing protein [Myxococcales bacterium]
MTSLFTMAAALALAACAAKPNPDTAPPTETPAPEPAPVAAEPTPEPEPAKPEEPPPPPAPTKDIVDTATEAGTFTTLLKAVETAGLKDTLKGPGPFTVFAPNDEAFAKLPKGELDKLLKNKKKLAEVLNYHVVSGAAVKSTEAAAMPTAKTVNGAEIAIDASSGVKLNGTATVVSADIMTTNGVIHVIDNVLMPPKAGAKPKK